MNAQIDIQVACEEPVPDEDDIRRFIIAALAPEHDGTELTVRLTSEREITELNQQYRGKTGSTNVLSFPADLPSEFKLPLLGDIVICAAVVEREANAQNKTSIAHWAHMLVHGCLHLQSYDHIQEEEAEQMEALEIHILSGLGFANPYSLDTLSHSTATEYQQP